MDADELELINDSSYFDFGCAKIDQQAHLQTCCFQVVHALCQKDIIQSFDRFQLNQHTIFNEQIGDILANNDFFKPDFNGMLLCNMQSGLP